MNHFGRSTEARFLKDAQERGLLVSMPFSGVPGYDAIVDTGKKLFRVQIKGCNMDLVRNTCSININRHNRKIAPIYDVLAVWVQVRGEGRWYFFGPRTRNFRIIRIKPKTPRMGWRIFLSLDPI